MPDDLRTAEHTPAGATSPGDPPRDPKRPHGGVLLALGWTLMTIGGLAFVVGLFVPSVFSPDSPAIGDIILATTVPVYNAWKWPTLYLGAALINIGFVVAALGLVVRALFFLPGRAVHWRELGGAIAKMEAEQEAEESRLRAAAAQRDTASE